MVAGSAAHGVVLQDASGSGSSGCHSALLPFLLPDVPLHPEIPGCRCCRKFHPILQGRLPHLDECLKGPLLNEVVGSAQHCILRGNLHKIGILLKMCLAQQKILCRLRCPNNLLRPQLQRQRTQHHIKKQDESFHGAKIRHARVNSKPAVCSYPIFDFQ